MLGVLLAVGGALVLLHVERWGTAGAFTSEKSVGTLILVVQTLSYSVFLVGPQPPDAAMLPGHAAHLPTFHLAFEDFV